MSRLGAAASLLFLLLAAAPAAAGVAPYERGILDRVSQTYRTLDRFHIEGRLSFLTESPSGRDEFDATFVLAAVRPDRLREELRHPTAGSLRVSDGRESWTYYSGAQQYRRESGALPDIGDAESGGGAGLRSGLAGSLLANYRGIGLTIEEARLRRVEYLSFEGSERECWVLEAKYQPAGEGSIKEFWIDRERHLVLRHRIRFAPSPMDSSVRIETITYDRIELNQPVPDQRFAFSPPAGAKEVRSFGPERADLTGREADDFKLRDLTGRRRSLGAERGKVVMLDFWATWCGPCRMQMPTVDRLDRELRGKGLVVFAVNQGETARVAREYMRRAGYATTTLLDEKSEVGDLFKVVGIPTLVIIDRAGRVAAYMVGVQQEADLRAALERAGLK